MSDFFAEEHFDANEVEPVSNDFELIPANTFVRAQIIEAKQEPISTRDDKGECLSLVWEVTEGQYANRKLWMRLNVKAKNFNDKTGKKTGEQATADAIARARAELSGVCHAVGVPTPKQNSDILFRPIDVKIGIQKSKDPQYKDQNTIIIPKSSMGEGAGSSTARVNPAANNGQAAQASQAAPRGNVPAFMQGRR